MKVKFTRVPNSILTALITLDFTKRQVKIILLVLRLTYGCQVPWAFYEKRYFQVAGLHRGAIGQELKQLVEMRVIEMNEEMNAVRVTPRVEAWQCSRNGNIDADSVPDLIRDMLSKQLRNVPVLRTLPDEKVDEIDDSEFQSRSVKKLKKEILKKDNAFLDKVKIYDRIDWRMDR
jgi:phage replication O-like protein O